MPAFDSTIPLRRDPYRYIRDTCAGLDTNSFESRLLLQPVLFLTGAKAARFFYDRRLFRRRDAAPEALRATLFGNGGVQGLDGVEHQQRKALFIDLLGPERIASLTARALDGLKALAERAAGEPIPLQDAFERALAEAVCDWAGLPLAEDEIDGRAKMLSDLFEHAGTVGPGHAKARHARRRADRWAAERIEAARRGAATPPPDSALARIADWRDPEGDALPPHVAAVELLNVLRPFVAISTYLTFAVHALAVRPTEIAHLRRDPERVPRFVQEVRRTYPFFPMVAARAAHDIRWGDHALPEGRLVVLDLWGTSRDAEEWREPDAFDPDRFRNWQGDPFTLIPQGGGTHELNHRCPGEWVTQDLMIAATRWLVTGMDWTVPPQDLRLDMTALPGLPGDRMIVANLRPREASPEDTETAEGDLPHAPEPLADPREPPEGR